MTVVERPICNLLKRNRQRLLFWTTIGRQICSGEHEDHFTASMGARVAQNNPETSADGTEFMDPTPKTLIAALETIRDTAANALNQIEQSQEERSMRWTCKACRYIKHFTRPVTLEAAGRCPRCKCTEFRPVLSAR